MEPDSPTASQAGAQGGLNYPLLEDWLEAGRLLFTGEGDHRIACPDVTFLPPATVPEVVVIGRSNVGKSSLINAITRRNSLARTSGTPGHTRMLHFYDVGGRLDLVDMPGYGYAKAGKKDVKQWQLLIKGYLRGRVPLKRGFLLIDSRHGVKPNDAEMMEFLDDMAVPYQLVLTKSDKLNKADQQAVLAQSHTVAAKHGACLMDVLLTSSAKDTGLEWLRASIAQAISG